MPNLFSKDEVLVRSPPVVAVRIIQLLQKAKGRKLTVTELADDLRKTRGCSAKDLYFGLIFAYALGQIDYAGPYIVWRDAET